jgi:phage shock protein PspC (stress-responsive transcriptional regulator)
MQYFGLDIRLILLSFILLLLFNVYKGMMGKHLYMLNLVVSDVYVMLR